LKENDIIVMGSDGVFDNIFKQDILAIVKDMVPKMADLSK
jgi:serine/threonine protein phosphatase PrpC